ncbi:MAG: acylphosphatase [Bacteroidota bacterium]
MQHISIRVFGRVQGVFYRASTFDVARNLNVNGFVRNEQDGSVFIEAEGDPEALEQLKEWCRHGPPGARVDQVIITPGELVGYTSFEIRR